MRTRLAVAGALALSGTAQAQQAPRPMGPPMGGPPNAAMMAMGPGTRGGVASMLLSHTGEFKLSDAQVTRLAAIARRTTDRHRAMQASMDSMRTNAVAPANPTPGAEGRPMPSPAMRAMAERMREQEHADLRDALAVLTPDQQALGWEMMMSRGGGRGMGGAPAQMMRRQVMQRGVRGRAGGPPQNPPAAGPAQRQQQPRQMRRTPAAEDTTP
jgi:hypothetical protein